MFDQVHSTKSTDRSASSRSTRSFTRMYRELRRVNNGIMNVKANFYFYVFSQSLLIYSMVILPFRREYLLMQLVVTEVEQSPCLINWYIEKRDRTREKE